MNRLEQIRKWVKEYELGYYFNPGGVAFFCPAFQDIEPCHCSENVGETGEYQDDDSWDKLSAWILNNKKNFERQKPKEYIYYSEGVIRQVIN